MGHLKDPTPSIEGLRKFKPTSHQTEYRLSRQFDPKYAIVQAPVQMFAAYKRKSDKVRPVDQAMKGESAAPGVNNWKAAAIKEHYDHTRQQFPVVNAKGFLPRFALEPEGHRLTRDRELTLRVGDQISPAERTVLLQVLRNREMALAWEWTDLRRISEAVTPPLKIETIEHAPWQASSFQVPRALKGEIVQMLKDRLETGILEHSVSPYRNAWFLVKKKNGKYRLINSATEINKRTIRDACIPPNADEFAEEFAGMAMCSYCDMFSGYDQLTLDPDSRKYTAIMTPMGLLQHTTVLQGATNSVAQFVRVITKILQDQIPDAASPFMDDIGIKGPRNKYNNEEEPNMPGVRKFVLEHIRNIDRTLADLELSGATISAEKTMFCAGGIKIVGYVCDHDGRRPDSAKVEAIVRWPPLRSQTHVRAFLGICVYYRIWIENFALIADPLYRLLKKDSTFEWGWAQSEAMETLKGALCNAPALMPISYEPEAGEIILAVDSSLQGWGAVLMQETDGKRHPARYESGLWNDAERRYDAGKRECRGLAKALRKMRQYLYGVAFAVELDAKTLVAQLNQSASDLPGALVTRWLAWIRLFDFDVRHVPGNKHLAADGLSRRPAAEGENQEPDDLDDFLDAQLAWLRVLPQPKKRAQMNALEVQMNPLGADRLIAEEVTEDQSTGEYRCPSKKEGHLNDPSVTGPIAQIENWAWTDPDREDDTERAETDEGDGRDLLKPGYGRNSELIALYLHTGVRPDEIPRSEFRRFRLNAHRHLVYHQHLFRKASKNVPLRRVVDSTEDRTRILHAMHDESGHRGTEATYRKIADRYWWDGLYLDIKKYCTSCSPCQRRRPNRQEEPLRSTFTATLWRRVNLDVVHMTPAHGKKYLVLARCDLSGYLEIAALAKATFRNILKFIKTDILCRHGMFERLVVDGGPENRGLAEELEKHFGIHVVTTSAYHPQAAGMIEVGHRPVKDALVKLEQMGMGSWADNFPTVAWADRISTKRTTGMSPYRLMYGFEPVMPIETDMVTWNSLPWREVCTTEELLARRTVQLQRRDVDVEEAALRLRRLREENKEYFDKNNEIRTQPFDIGQLVLLYESSRQLDHSTKTKLAFRWRGPYKVSDARPNTGTYWLEELDGTPLAGTFAGNRLKKFVERDGETNLNTTAPQEPQVTSTPTNRPGIVVDIPRLQAYADRDPARNVPSDPETEEESSEEEESSPSNRSVRQHPRITVEIPAPRR